MCLPRPWRRGFTRSRTGTWVHRTRLTWGRVRRNADGLGNRTSPHSPCCHPQRLAKVGTTGPQHVVFRSRVSRKKYTPAIFALFYGTFRTVSTGCSTSPAPSSGLSRGSTRRKRVRLPEAAQKAPSRHPLPYVRGDCTCSTGIALSGRFAVSVTPLNPRDTTPSIMSRRYTW